MAIIDNKHYKLDIYNIKLSNLIFKCSENKRYCKSMANNLVFYDRDKVLDLHAKHLYDREPYNIETLEKLQFLNKNETIDGILPLENYWLAVLLKKQKTNEPIMDKVMYISPNGEGYVSDEIEPALKGSVPEEVYLKDASEVVHAYLWLDKKYQDGTHDEFMKKYATASRNFIEKILGDLIKSEEVYLSNEKFKNKDKISIEDIFEAVMIEYKRKSHNQDLPKYKVLDTLLRAYGSEDVLDMCKKYPEDSNEEKTQNSEEILEK